jgi:hypothetical protein
VLPEPEPELGEEPLDEPVQETVAFDPADLAEAEGRRAPEPDLAPEPEPEPVEEEPEPVEEETTEEVEEPTEDLGPRGQDEQDQDPGGAGEDLEGVPAPPADPGTGVPAPEAQPTG